jgi:hypothetical protein
MRTALMVGIALTTLAGCSTGDIQHYSTYDLDRDGVMDRRCPGKEYDLERNRMYSWRNKASDDCADDAPQEGS